MSKKVDLEYFIKLAKNGTKNFENNDPDINFTFTGKAIYILLRMYLCLAKNIIEIKRELLRYER